jgi:hypothetical protein
MILRRGLGIARPQQATASGTGDSSLLTFVLFITPSWIGRLGGAL